MASTNSTEIAYARQSGFKQPVASPENYRILERSAINQFGNQITKAEPTRTSLNRNPRKKRTVALDSGVELEAPLDFDSMLEFGEGFTYGKPAGPIFFDIASASSNSIAVKDGPIGAERAGKIVTGTSGNSILCVKGLKSTSSKTSFLITAAPTAASSNLGLSGVVAETIADNRRARVFVAGVRGFLGDIEIDADGNIISSALDFTVLGLALDQAIYVGGTDEANCFDTAGNKGFAQISKIETNKLTLYNRDNDYSADDGDGIRIDILFGPLLRNYAIGNDNFQKLFYTFGMTTEFDDGSKTYEYAQDNACDSMTFALSDEFATVTLGFVGSITTNPSDVQAAGHANAAPLNSTQEFATNVDLVQFSVSDLDGSNLMTDFDDLTLTLSNGAAARKIGTKLTPGQINISKFRANIDTTVIFSNPDIIERIKCDKEVSLRFPIWNDDGGIYFHIPHMGLEGGDRSYTEDDSVTISSTGYAFNEDRDGACINITVFPLLPDRPCS